MSYANRRKLSKRIRLLRERRGLTQEQAAKACRLKYRYYQEYEGKNPRDMRLSTMERIANGLDVSLAELLDFEER